MKFLKQKKEYKDLISVLKNVFKNQNFTIFFGVVDNLCMINVFFGQICNLVLDVQPEIQILYWLFKRYQGTDINDVRRFSTIFDPPSPPNVRFLPSNVRFFGVILDPPPLPP